MTLRWIWMPAAAGLNHAVHPTERYYAQEVTLCHRAVLGAQAATVTQGAPACPVCVARAPWAEVLLALTSDAPPR